LVWKALSLQINVAMLIFLKTICECEAQFTNDLGQCLFYSQSLIDGLLAKKEKNQVKLRLLNPVG
jgi:hypothetical protein